MRKKKWTPAAIKALEGYDRRGLSDRQIAQILGVTERAVTDARQKYIGKKKKKKYRKIAVDIPKEKEKLHQKLNEEKNKDRKKELNKISQRQNEDFDNLLLDALKKENKRLRSQLKKEKCRTELLVDSVRSSIASLPSLKTIPSRKKPKYKFDEEQANLVLGDIHIGEENTLRDTIGMAEYNFDLFKKRFWRLIDKIIKITDIHRKAYPINRLNVLNVGDDITGELVYPNQAHYVDRNTVDQIFEGSQVVAEGVYELAKVFPEIVFVGIGGNHGRVGKQYSYRTNFDYIFLKALQNQLRDVQNVKVFVSEASACLFKLESLLVLLAHGDEIRSTFSLPFYGLDRFARRWASLAGNRIDLAIIGHHHRQCDIDVAYGEAIINGAFPGGSWLSTKKLQEAGYPMQKFFGIHPRQGKTWTYNIKLGYMPEFKPDSNGFYTPVS